MSSSDAPQLTPIAEPTDAGRYRVFAKIGQGGMAEVFLAMSRGAFGLGKIVVIKRMRPEVAEDPELQSMFVDEARLAARFNHPNVVHTYEVCQEGAVCFLAMEYLEGQSASQIRRASAAKNVPLPAAVAVRIIADALRGLHYAHTLCDYDGTPMRIIHRDISPQNLFVGYEGTTKLLDFGIAKSAANASHTQAGVLKGKLAYMAPEQIRGTVVDHRADVFSMGVVLWELLVQRRLFPGDAATAMHKLLSAPIEAPSTLAPGIPPELDRIVATALKRDPAERYPTADAMRCDLERCLRGMQGGESDTLVRDYLETLFRSQREEQQARVERYMSRARPVSVESVSRVPVMTGQVRTVAGMGSGETPIVSERSIRSSAQSSKGWALASVAGITIALGVGLFIGLGSQARSSVATAATHPPPVLPRPIAEDGPLVRARLEIEPNAVRPAGGGTPQSADPTGAAPTTEPSAAPRPVAKQGQPALGTARPVPPPPGPAASAPMPRSTTAAGFNPWD